MFELKPMERESSTLAASAYDPVGHVMRIQFKNGKIYDYQNVSAQIYENICDLGGSYFSQEVKNQPLVYPYSKVQ